MLGHGALAPKGPGRCLVVVGVAVALVGASPPVDLISLVTNEKPGLIVDPDEDPGSGTCQSCSDIKEIL